MGAYDQIAGSVEVRSYGDVPVILQNDYPLRTLKGFYGHAGELDSAIGLFTF